MMRKKSVGILFSGLSLFSYKYPLPISPLELQGKLFLLILTLYYKKKAKFTRWYYWRNVAVKVTVRTFI